MMHSQRLSWIEPLDLAASITEPYWVLLHSSVSTNYSGRYSYLACKLAERIESNDFSTLAFKLGNDKSTFENAWFGYMGYGLKNALENIATDQPGPISLPDLCMMRFAQIYQFDHETKTLTLWKARPNDEPYTAQSSSRETAVPHVTAIHSNMSTDEYLQKAQHIIDHIHAGDLYQANLTRKFYGEFDAKPDGFSLFRKLCAKSPAPYSAYIRIKDSHIISSSPELFLHIDASGHVRARPIKGTAPRYADAVQDQKSKRELQASAKDRAENLMIVDLMRNDLSRTCNAGSVQAQDLFEVTTHATIHHMASTVTGTKQPQRSALDTVKYAFPPGSMTGAPKIRAMNMCSEMEKLSRGVYSGAIGWFGGDGSCELSVVIRTLIVQDKKFEFQVGGGIVADSTPQGELTELIHKATGILSCLELPVIAIERL